MYKLKSISKHPLAGLALVIAVCLVLATPARAAKTVVGTYHTSQSADKVFPEAASALAQEGFQLKFTDKSQGTIQADRMAWGSGTPAYSVFLTISKDGAGTSIFATFTRQPGLIGHGPDKWAKAFGRDLRAVFPDITMGFEER